MAVRGEGCWFAGTIMGHGEFFKSNFLRRELCVKVLYISVQTLLYTVLVSHLHAHRDRGIIIVLNLLTIHLCRTMSSFSSRSYDCTNESRLVRPPCFHQSFFHYKDHWDKFGPYIFYDSDGWHRGQCIVIPETSFGETWISFINIPIDSLQPCEIANQSIQRTFF